MAFGLGVLAAGTVVEAVDSVFSLKAVKKNDVAIAPATCNLAVTPHRCSAGNVGKICVDNNDCGTPTSNLSVAAGDKIEAEIFLSGWLHDFPAPLPGAQEGVRVAQAKMGVTGYVGDPDPITNPNRNGKVIPDGWCAPLGSTIECVDSTTCTAAFPICDPDDPIQHVDYGCTCAGHNPELGALMKRDRPDFLFGLFDGNYAISFNTLSYAYVGAATSSSVRDTGVPRYLGTLILRVSANACGTFRIGFLTDEGTNFIGDEADPPFVVFPTLQPLVLTVSDCGRLLVSCNPVRCNEDARIPHDRLNRGIKLNTNTIAMTYSKPTAGMTAADFEMSLVPYVLPGDVLPVINPIGGVTTNGNNVTLLFQPRIPPSRWTCVRDRFSDRRCCMGSLPGDADDSRTSEQVDIFKVLNNLNGGVIPALPAEKCDTDRSGFCAPADLLMVVDLLNGADAFDPYRGTQLEPCPLFLLPP